MLPLLFVCTSQYRPLRVRNPIRCNRRILSQPCFYRSYSPRYPFGAPLRSHLLYLSVPFLSALRDVLCKTSMINTLFLIAFAYSYSSTGNPDCQCSFCCHAIVNVYNGILYKVIQAGTGKVSPNRESVVSVHYKGTLINGREFDNSWKRGCPEAFRLNQVIEGWQLALQEMRVGDRWIIYIPYNFGYGNRASGPIPAFSTLIFEVELLGIA